MPIGSVIGNIGQTITKGAGKGLEAVSNTKIVSNQIKAAKEDPAKFIANVAMFSLISKDFINCVVYTVKSWTNEKLDNPHFMALMDLVQGVLNVSLQTLVGKKLIESIITPAWQSKYTGTIKTSPIVDSLEKSKAAKKAEKMGRKAEAQEIKNICKKFREEANKEIDNLKDEGRFKKPLHATRVGENLQDVMKTMDSKLGIKFGAEEAAKLAGDAQKYIKKSCKDPFTKGLGLILTILGTTALIKRTIIPFISTPIAGGMDDWMKKKEAERAEAQKDLNAAA